MSSILISRFQRLAKEVSWIVAGQVAAVIGSLVMVRVLTEYLDPAEYGQLALGMTIAGLVNQVAMGGLTSGIGRFYSIAVEKGDFNGYLRASKQLMEYATLGVGLIAILLFFFIKSTGQTQLLGLTVAVLVFSILSGYNSALSGIQNAARQRSIVALHGAMNSWLNIGLVTCVVLWVSRSSTAVVMGYAITAFIVTVSQLFFLNKLVNRPAKITQIISSENWAKQMFQFSWPMIVGGLFNWGYYASQRWSLELFASTSEVGKFYALTQIAYSPISMAGGMFMSMLVPIMYARAGDPKNHQRVSNVRSIVFKISGLGIAATLMVAGLTVFSHEIIFKYLVADQYRDVSSYMPLVVISAGLLQSSITLGTFISTANKTQMVLPLAIYGQLIIAGSNLIFSYIYGMHGLLISMMFGAVLHFIWMYSIFVKCEREII